LIAHACESVNETRDQKFSGAIDDLRAFGDGESCAWAYGEDAPIANVYDCVLNIVGGVAPVGDVDDGAPDENERRGGIGFRRLILGGEGERGGG
jgi:hypothetical protein